MTRERRAPNRPCTCQRTPARPTRTDAHPGDPAELELLTVPEVMGRLRLGRTAVYDLIRTDRLASIRIGRARRIPIRALNDLITRETQTPQEPR